jgi:23S rRNA (guanosine2251-2'-O)-methyltransferase
VKHFRPQARPKKSSLLIGRETIIYAIREGKAIDRIYINSKIGNETIRDIKSIATENNIPINYVPVEKLNSFNVDAHDGFIGLLSKVHYQDLQQVITWVVERGEAPLFLILDGITDIRNIGGIARTAFCTGVQAIIIPDKGVGALNEDAILTSAGALEKISICRVNSLMKAVDELHLNGIKVLASEMTASEKLFEMDLKVPVAIVMGSEEKGIYPALMKQCDQKFKIPMVGDFESLNVSVATGMILYEAMKQRLS